MLTFLFVIHALVCILLVLVVLLQSGKEAGLGVSFGGAGSQTMFGGRGAGDFLTKVTTILAIMFLGLSVLIAFLSSKDRSVVEPGAKPKIVEKEIGEGEEEDKEDREIPDKEKGKTPAGKETKKIEGKTEGKTEDKKEAPLKKVEEKGEKLDKKAPEDKGKEEQPKEEKGGIPKTGPDQKAAPKGLEEKKGPDKKEVE